VVAVTHHEEKHEEADEAQEDIELSEEQADDVKGGLKSKYGLEPDVAPSDKV
jgi:hypothetical protein